MLQDRLTPGASQVRGFRLWWEEKVYVTFKLNGTQEEFYDYSIFQQPQTTCSNSSLVLIKTIHRTKRKKKRCDNA